jgi:membrane-associated phospholipid phosphatase
MTGAYPRALRLIRRRYDALLRRLTWPAVERLADVRAAGKPSSAVSRARAWRPVALGGRLRDPQFRLQATLATIFALSVGAFAHVVEDYLDREALVRWDVEFSRWLHAHASSTATSFFKIFTLSGNVAFLALLTVALALLLLRRARVQESAFLLVSALGIEVLNAVLKLLFHRPRPELAYVHLDTYSFPSGHATGSTAIYGIVFYFLARNGSTLRRALAAVSFVVLILAIGFSRLYLEVHYLSDVLAGCSLGAAWAAGTLFVYEVGGRDMDVLRHVPAPIRNAVLRHLVRERTDPPLISR